MNNFEYIIVGSGYAGAVCARVFAEKTGKNVLVMEKRNHIAGNAYDEYNKDGILIHKYGPHIFHTDKEDVFEFLSRFTEWIPYRHKVKAEIDGQEVPLPINFTSIPDSIKIEYVKDDVVLFPFVPVIPIIFFLLYFNINSV